MILPPLKILPQAITLAVPFAVFTLNRPMKPDYLRAALCIMSAVTFIFRG